jgi:tRNA pseudouridine55 synthase
MVPSGVLLCAKRAGVTSHDVVAQVRRALPRGARVGHAGTLDPFATGLLLVLVGRATRAQRFLLGLPKTYRAVARLGWVSDTGDRDGELVLTGRRPAELTIPVGEQQQRPPAYSAVKVQGERAYRRARRGEEVDLEPRAVTVYRAELLWHEGDRAAFEIECSAGTYVRSLITDLGDAYCESLDRTAIGPFRLEDALEGDLRGVLVDRLVPLGDALAFLPRRRLSDEQTRAVRHGRRIPRGSAARGPMRLESEGELIAIGEPRDDEIQPVVVFAPG